MRYYRDISDADMESCFDSYGEGAKRELKTFSCHHGQGNQYFRYDMKTKQIIHGPVRNNFCVEVDIGTQSVYVTQCNKDKIEQRWIWGFVNETNLANWLTYGSPIGDAQEIQDLKASLWLKIFTCKQEKNKETGFIKKFIKIFASNEFQQRLLAFFMWMQKCIDSFRFYHFFWVWHLSLCPCIDFKFAGLHHTPRISNYISINHIHATWTTFSAHSRSLYQYKKLYQKNVVVAECLWSCFMLFSALHVHVVAVCMWWCVL